MISELDIGRCVSKYTGPKRGGFGGGLTSIGGKERVPARTLGLEGGGFSLGPVVDCDVSHWLERRTNHNL